MATRLPCADLLSFPILASNIQSEAPPSWCCHPWHLGSCCFFTNLTSTCQPHRVTMADSQREEHEVYAPHWTLAMCHMAWLPYSVQLDLLFKPAACLPLVDPPCSNHFIDNHQLGNLPHWCDICSDKKSLAIKRGISPIRVFRGRLNNGNLSSSLH